jgi:hypothetical protein
MYLPAAMALSTQSLGKQRTTAGWSGHQPLVYCRRSLGVWPSYLGRPRSAQWSSSPPTAFREPSGLNAS